MPRIPSENYYPTADVGAVSPFRIDTSVLSPDQAAIPGRQEQAMGQGLMQLGDTANRIAIDFQEQINQSRVLDARNQLVQGKGVLADDPKNGYLSKTGLAALQPEEGKSLTDVYLDKYQQHSGEVMKGLDNDRQRLMLKPHADDIANQIQSETQRHALNQFKSYQLSNLDGQLKLSADDAARNWQDPTAVQKSLLQAMTAVTSAGTIQGKAPSEIEAQIKTTASTVHLKVLDAALQNNNASYANLYFQMHKDPIYVNSDKQVVPKGTDGAMMMDGGMSANDILHFQGAMNKNLDNGISQGAVSETVKKYTSQIIPTNLDRLTGIVTGLESGGQDLDKTGAPLTSPKGAKYAMQVMPETANKPGFGIRPAANDSPAEYNRVGQEYLSKLVQKYGNVPQALAAYNAGPGAVDTAIKDKGGAWLGSMPDETQKYVNKGMTKFGAGEGATSLPTEQEFVADALGRLGPNPRPEQTQLTRAAAEHQFGIITKSVAEQGDKALHNLERDIIAKGGDFNQADPQLKMELARLAPDKYDNATAFAKRISEAVTGKPVEMNPAALNTSIAYPERLAAMKDSEFLEWQTANFPKEQWTSVAKRRDDAINGKIDMSEGGVNHKALGLVVNGLIGNIGLNPNPNPKELAAYQQVSSIKGYVTQQVLDNQKQIGRKMTEDELGIFTRKLFAKDVTMLDTHLGFTTGSTTHNLLGLKPSELPRQAYDGIKQALIASGKKVPTDQDILQQYWRMH
jgi:soluble lytic murein transglycosylase